MKIRNGFVSNSSTTSFLIYGACLEKTKLENFDLRLLNDERFDTYYYINYIGMSWDSVKDNETGKQFKENIEKKLKEFFGDDIECCTFKEAWYDG